MLFFWTFYASKSHEKKKIIHKNIKQHNFDNTFFLNQQISILEWFLNDHVTLKTGVMMLKIKLCITQINSILKYIQIENGYLEL